MADYYSQAVFQPTIPKALITPKDEAILAAFNIVQENCEGDWYLCSDDFRVSGWLDYDTKVTEDDLYFCLQGIIKRSNGEVPFITVEESFTCSKLRPDGFGGVALFITADDVKCVSTTDWLSEQREIFKNTCVTS